MGAIKHALLDSNHHEVPLIHHSPGRYHSLKKNLGSVYDRIIASRLFSDRKRKNAYSKPDNLEIVVCHNYSKKPIAVRTLEYIGIHNYVELGKDIKEWRNIFKLHLLLNHLRKINAEFVLHLDANDSIIDGDPTEVLRRFRTYFDCDVLFNAEKTSHPSCGKNPLSPFRGTPEEEAYITRYEKFELSKYEAPFCFFNSGCFIGRRIVIISLLEKALDLITLFPSYPNSDQAILREIHRSTYPRVQIDDKRKIFQALVCLKREEILLTRPLSPIEFYWQFFLELSVRKFRYRKKRLMQIFKKGEK